jgi:hypothetical protein
MKEGRDDPDVFALDWIGDGAMRLSSLDGWRWVRSFAWIDRWLRRGGFLLSDVIEYMVPIWGGRRLMVMYIGKADEMSGWGWVGCEGGEWGSTLFVGWLRCPCGFGLILRRGVGGGVWAERRWFLGCSVCVCMGGGVVSGLTGDGFVTLRSVGAGGVVWSIVSFSTDLYE